MKNSMAEDTKRTRRTDERLIADLEARIAALKARASQKKARRSPSLAYTVKAVKSIDAAMAATEDGAMRKALEEARTTLSACLALQGFTVAAGASEGKARGRRSPEHVEQMAEAVLAHVQKNPGQRGEQIAQARKTNVGTMRLPMKKLIAEKMIKTKGQRRGMTYFAA
jgi:hypothetical protein